MIIIRFLAQVVISFGHIINEKNISLATIIIAIGGLYLAALIGLILRQKWGAVLVAIIALIDISSSFFFLRGASLVGVLIYDFILLALSYKEYKLY